MRRLLALLAVFSAPAIAQQPFTLQQTFSAPYSTNLTAAPAGARFAWVEHTEGRNNLWVGGAHETARELTHNAEDNAQDITSVTWSPDATQIVFVFGAQTGASGRPANPAELQPPPPISIWLVPADASTPPRLLVTGRAPLFAHDGRSLFFLRDGQVWTTDLTAADGSATPTQNCHPQRSEGAGPKDCHPERSEGPASPAFPPPTSAHQLVYDRGSASSVTLSPDGKLLAYISHRRTHSFLALYNLETKTLTFPAPSTGDDSAPIFSRDGKYLAWLRFPFTDPAEFASNRTSPNPWSIQLDDLSTNTTRTLFTPEANQPGSAEPRMSTGEPHLYWTAPLAPTTTDLSSRPERSAVERSQHSQPLAPPTESSSRPKRSAVERPVVSSSGDILFFSEADGWVHLYSLDTGSTPTPRLLTPGKFEVEDASLDATGRLLFWASNDSSRDPLDVDRRHIWQLNLTCPGEAPKQRIPDGIETHPLPSADDTTLAALVSDARTPMHPALIENGRLTPLHPASAPPYLDTSLLTPQQVLFPSASSRVEPSEAGVAAGFSPRNQATEREGALAPEDQPLTIHGQLFLPKTPTTARRPAILFFHGGPKRQMLLGYPAMDYYSNAYAMNQYLASRGYIVLSVNYRGGIGYGLNFRQCEHCGADGAAEYADALGAIAWLRSRPDVDPKRIGIWGGSYGGYFTALALARNSDLFAAGVDFHGVHEWADEDNARADWLRGSLAQQEKIAALAHAGSPMADIDKWRSPVLLIHGDDDPDVAYTQTPMLADALRARNVHVEELIFPDELHGFVLHRDWLAAYQAAANFFDRTLKPPPPPAH